MARREPVAPASNRPGAYEWLAGRQEADYRQWCGSVHGRVPGARYPRQYVLDKLRAGRTATVTAGELPVEYGGTPKPRTRIDAEARTDAELAAAAAVLVLHPDGRVVPAGPGDVDELDWLDEYRNL